MKTMKKLWMAASVAAISMTGCQEEQFEGTPDPDNYYASVETFGTDTRTALGEGHSVVWSSEDRIAIFEGSGTGQAYQVLDAYVGKSSGEFAEVEGLVAEGTGADIEGTIAVYPFYEDLTVTSGDDETYVIEGITFPSEQKYIADSFSDEAFPMTAICENGSRSLPFKNIGGVLKLSLTGSYSVSQITLTGNSGEPLSGSATVTLGPDGIPSVKMSDDASTSVSLVCDPAVQLDPNTATDFYISIPPTEFEGGFTVTITDGEENTKTKIAENHNKVSRSSILKMPDLNIDDIESYAVFTQIDQESLKESIWESGMINENGDYILLKNDLDNRICVAGNENTGPELYFVLDENNDVIEFLYEDLYCTIEYDDNNMYVNVVTETENQHHIFDFKRNTSNVYNATTSNTLDSKSSETEEEYNATLDAGKALWNISTIGGAVNLIVDSFKGKDISRDLDVYALCVLAGTKSNIAGYALSAIYEMYKTVEEFHKIDEERYFGNCSVSISSAIQETDGSWTLVIDIRNIPDADMIMPGGIKVGAVIGKNKNKVRHPQNHSSEAFNPQANNCWIIAEKDVDNNHPNSTVTMTIESYHIEEDEIYYVRPYLIQFITNGFSIIESSKQIRYGEFITIPHNEKWVDLGLSVLWAAYNVGASSPEEYGGYYAWGETSTKSDYTWENYKYSEKYYYGDGPNYWDWVGKFIGNEISGTSYDVAHVQWGGGARMPTLAEVQELVDNCTFTGGSYNGVRGNYVTGPNGNIIFLPFAGFASYGVLYDEGNCGYFLSGTYNYDDEGNSAFSLCCYEDHGYWNGGDRSCGQSVRPVTEK